ncbi:hypothetical protein T265_05445 [Opisthorchis viverrini]|uniref:Uncharacterized protein n=1 Tax=Opisthorchis viverrini TaxID=6198 RepID=A0A075AFB7_OPIVI|nr:hypothetical protein T265_05445 [Opisthorchis viverrini]KER27559.1 hypothetical protein T265_05445 [Opisthorchis viverrini]
MLRCQLRLTVPESSPSYTKLAEESSTRPTVLWIRSTWHDRLFLQNVQSLDTPLTIQGKPQQVVVLDPTGLCLIRSPHEPQRPGSYLLSCMTCGAKKRISNEASRKRVFGCAAGTSIRGTSSIIDYDDSVMCYACRNTVYRDEWERYRFTPRASRTVILRNAGICCSSSGCSQLAFLVWLNLLEMDFSYYSQRGHYSTEARPP